MKQLLKGIAALSMKSAKKAGNCASVLGMHQPKAPKKK